MLWLILALIGGGVAVAAASSKKPPAKAPPPVSPPAKPPLPVLDKNLAPAEKSAITKALASKVAPSDLENYAATLRPTSIKAAQQLEARAKALRAKGVKG
jgi:hypothetical protein